MEVKVQDHGGDRPPVVAVIILNFNGWRDTVHCIRSLLSDDDSVSERMIVVCDNASSDGSMERIEAALQSDAVPYAVMSRVEAEDGGERHVERHIREVVLIRNGGNLGFAGGCNVGLRWALRTGATHFWLLNNDTEAASGAMDALVARMGTDPRIGLCGSRLIYYHDRGTVQARGGAVYDARTATSRHIGVHEAADRPEGRPEDIEQQMSYVVGASMMASRRFLQEVGLMQEDYFLYFEEMDWAVRGQRLGFRLGYAPASVVYHKEGATIGSSHHRDGGSLLSMRFLARNRLMFTRRHHPAHLNAVRRQLLYETAVHLKRRQYAKASVLLAAVCGKLEAMPPARLLAPRAPQP